MSKPVILFRLLLWLGPALGVLPATGSAKPEGGAELWAASATNILGWVESRTDEKLRPVMSAMKAALEEIGYVQTESRVKPVEAVLTFRGRDDAWISVKLKEFPEFTNIKIRCGLTGNDALSRQILQRVYTRL